MDWKRLVQFATQGSSELEQYAILLIRVSPGLFFTDRGFFFDSSLPGRPDARK